MTFSTSSGLTLIILSCGVTEKGGAGTARPLSGVNTEQKKSLSRSALTVCHSVLSLSSKGPTVGLVCLFFHMRVKWYFVGQAAGHQLLLEVPFANPDQRLHLLFGLLVLLCPPRLVGLQVLGQ